METKSGNAALVGALRNQLGAATPWTRVGKNAEMIAWPNYRLQSCPYPLTVGLERFHTPKGMLHAVLIRSQEGSQVGSPDLEEWFHAYNEKIAPLRRNVTTEEVGNTAAFLCSDLASGITGGVVYVDAGFSTGENLTQLLEMG